MISRNALIWLSRQEGLKDFATSFRLFKKLTGSTPHNYLAGIRAARAQLLLADTELSVTEIGSRVGYLSASHFTKAFRLATGTTPREFRKALISANNHSSANERQ